MMPGTNFFIARNFYHAGQESLLSYREIIISNNADHSI